MDRYNYCSNNGRTHAARFCRCGHAAIVSTEAIEELFDFEVNWDDFHSGVGHGLVDFDTWIELISRAPAGVAG